LRNLPVLFIGGEEPWSRYAPIPMGQWPAVLSAPAFRDRLRALPQHGFLRSPDFAAAIERQWQHLSWLRSFHAIQDRVRSIAPAAHGFDIDIGRPDPVKAELVDVCGGPGPARRLCDHQVDAALRPYPSNLPGPNGWRLLETGESFLEQGTVIAGGNGVTVIGGGPTAAW
jgi:hypothetical protein